MAVDWTVSSLIAWATDYLTGHGVDAPRLSAELMLARVLGLQRIDLYLRHDQPLAAEELADFKALLLRRREHEPMAHILGSREFYGLTFQVSPDVLVPRPETEHLVEAALDAARDLPAPRILDLCTGSGCVALALAHHLPEAEVWASDISPQALAVAQANAQALGLAGRVRWVLGSLWEPLAAQGGFFDLITANPPYVRAADWAGLDKTVRDYEPKPALVSGPGGLEIIEPIIFGAPAHLQPHGRLMVELGAGQHQPAVALAQKTGAYDVIRTAPDLSGLERVLICERSDYG